MKRSAALYVGGIGFSRLCLLFSGTLVASFFGTGRYAHYVLFLSLGNVILNLCSMGVIPRILALPPESDPELQTITRGALVNLFLVLPVTLLCGMLTPSLPDQNILSSLALICYCTGNYLILLTSAQLNRKHRHHIAGRIWFAVGVLPVLTGSITLTLLDYPDWLLCLTLTWLAMGVGVRFLVKDRHAVPGTPEAFLSKSTLRAAFRGVWSGLFGLPFLLIFYVVGRQVTAIGDSDSMAAFMLGLQLFTITTFLPGVLGAVFLPTLAQTSVDRQKVLIKRLALLYSGMGLGFMLLIWLALPLVFAVYHIPSTTQTSSIVLFWQLSSILAAMGAIQNQILVARSAYGFLLAGSLIWAGVALLASGYHGFDAYGSSAAIMLAYLVLQGIYWHHYLRTSRPAASTTPTPAGQTHFLANPYSPHVRHWMSLMHKLGMETRIYTAHDSTEGPLSNADVHVVFPLRRLCALPLHARYIALGLWARFSRSLPANTLLHAHNTSGYGLAAFLSGKPYLVTTYGSEIFDASHRGTLYRSVLRRILAKAGAITSASPAMTQALVEHFSVPRARIHEFSLGVEEHFEYSEEARCMTRASLGIQDSPVWIINRRAHPHYHTLEVIHAFLTFRKIHQRGCLIVMEGDADPRYLASVQALTEPEESIRLIPGFISREHLAALLSAADFSISVPKSDQLSSSILEGAACGAYPLLADLPSYGAVSDFSYRFTIDDFHNSRSFEVLFEVSLDKMERGDYATDRARMLESVKKFRFDTVLPTIRALYAPLPGRHSAFEVQEQSS